MKSMSFDQKKLWDKIYKEETFHPLYLRESKFAKECIKYLPKNSKILELGCGLGKDAIFFAKRGHFVVALDFSKEAIKKAKENAKKQKIKNIVFINRDIGKKFNFRDLSFDVVYANLSLHYFTEEITEKIFGEIARVLKKKGLFCAQCRSIKDPLYGKGELVEKNIYILNGHLRHFFCKKELKEKLKKKFKIKKLQTEKIKFKNEIWMFVKVIAEKI
jgi:ubiquinone/menaquinone biosynthesis C-methylase UbiE